MILIETSHGLKNTLRILQIIVCVILCVEFLSKCEIAAHSIAFDEFLTYKYSDQEEQTCSKLNTIPKHIKTLILLLNCSKSNWTMWILIQIVCLPLFTTNLVIGCYICHL